MTEEQIEVLKKSSMPDIDWEARHYVSMNNGEHNKWLEQWFKNFAQLVFEEGKQQGIKTILARGQE